MIRTVTGYVPVELKQRLRRSPLCVSHRAAVQNVYFACVQKTASRWLRRILKDKRVFRGSGLEYFDYIRSLPFSERRSLTQIRFPDGFPAHTIVGPLYTAFGGYESIPKPAEYRAFFVMRDPRDIVVSWYYSMKYSHASSNGRFDEVREDLVARSESDGLRRAMELLAGSAELFPALRSWAGASERDPCVRLVRYEDLTGPHSAAAFARLFEHCDIRLNDKKLTRLLDEHSFKRISGRRQGQEDVKSHYRKGKAGDWKDHLDNNLLEYFREVTGDLLEVLGYE